MKSKKIAANLLALLLPIVLHACSNHENEEIPEPTDATLYDKQDEEVEQRESSKSPADADAKLVDSPDHASPSAATLSESTPDSVNGSSAVTRAAHAPADKNQASSGSYQSTGKGERLWTFVDHVVIRSSPSTSASAVGHLEYGTPVDNLGKENEWVKIGENQYIPSRALTDRKARFYHHGKNHQSAH